MSHEPPPLVAASGTFERLLAILLGGFALWAIYVFIASSPPAEASLTRLDAQLERFESVTHGWDIPFGRHRSARPSTSFFIGRDLQGAPLRLAFSSKALPSSPGIFQGRPVTVLTDRGRTQLYEMTAYGHPVVFRSAIESETSRRRTFIFMMAAGALLLALGCVRRDLLRLPAVRRALGLDHASSSPSSQ